MFVTKRDWFEAEKRCTRVVHRSNVLLVPTRRQEHAELSIVVDITSGAARSYGLTRDAFDVDRVILAVPNADDVAFAGATCVADIDVVVARGHFHPGSESQRNIIGPSGVIKERTATDCCVTAAASITQQRINADSNVFAANGVTHQRGDADGGVLIPEGIRLKSANSSCCVGFTSRVVLQRIHTNGCVIEASGIIREREYSAGGIICARGIT